MVNTVNTDFKLTTLDNTALWTCDSNEPIDNINQQVAVNFEKIDRPRDDQDNWLSWGLDGRSIMFQGVATYDTNFWELSSAVNSKKLLKLWLGEDWFTYVIGKQCTQIRDQRSYNQGSYTVAMIGVDPFWYNSNSDAGSGTTFNLVVPKYSALSGGTISVNLESGTAATNTTYVEPVFWVVGGASTNITAMTITDDGGRTLNCTFQDAVGNGETFIILPWRVKTLEGYMIQDSCVIKLEGGSGVTSPAAGGSTPGTWGLDFFNLDSKYQYIDGTAPRACINTSSATVLSRIKSYPRAEDGVTTSFDVAFTGTSTDVAVYAQYCWRRL